MTIAMPDSIRPQDMPKGYLAYLAYVDGERSKDADQVRAMFPGAHILTLTVLGGGAKADGCDMEPGDLSPASAADWLWRQVTAGAWRPVLYASRDSVPRVLQPLSQLGVTRPAIRILSAHYGEGEHICSPAACGAPFTADGTQWTDRFRTPSGALVDMSMLAGNFFGPPSAWVFGAVRGLTARPGHTSVLLSWSSPAHPEPGAVHHYQVTVRHEGRDVPSYPRDVPKGTNPQSWQGGSLQPGTQYEALVRAMTADGSHASPWASVVFTTGHV